MQETARDVGLILGSGRSPGATRSSILAGKNLMVRGTWQAPVHGVAKSWTHEATEHACMGAFRGRRNWLEASLKVVKIVHCMQSKGYAIWEKFMLSH